MYKQEVERRDGCPRSIEVKEKSLSKKNRFRYSSHFIYIGCLCNRKHDS